MAWAELTDVRCHYEVLGEGEPLLLIPGLGTTSRLWDPVAPELAPFFSLILLDNRGIGRSVALRPPASTADWAADLVELLDHLQLDRAHVLGISLGGIIAQRLAVEHPSRVDRLVLVSCADCFSPYLRQITGLLGQSLRHFPKQMFVRTVELLGTAPEFLDANPELVEQRVRAKCASGVSTRALAAQLRCLCCSEIAPCDYAIHAPTLVVAGEYDALVPACYSRRMAERIPGSRFVLVPGGGHNPLIDCADRVLPEIIDFLRASGPMARAGSIAEMGIAGTAAGAVGAIGVAPATDCENGAGKAGTANGAGGANDWSFPWSSFA